MKKYSVIARILPDYNADIFGDAYSDMTDDEINLDLELYDAIIESLLPEWASRCGDEIIVTEDAPEDEVDEFDINAILADACQILWSAEPSYLAAKYLPERA